MSSLCMALYSFGSSPTLTGSSSVIELLETIGNSDGVLMKYCIYDLAVVDRRRTWTNVTHGLTLFGLWGKSISLTFSLLITY